MHGDFRECPAEVREREGPDLLGYSLAALSHEMKNILQVLQLRTDAVDRAIKDRDLDGASKGWDVLKRKIREISFLTTDILHLARKAGPHFKQISPGEVLHKAVDSLRWKADSMGVRLVHFSEPLLPPARLGPETAPLMLCNLILNAIQACRTGPQEKSPTVMVRADFHGSSEFRFEVESNLLIDPFSMKPGISPTLLVAGKICSEHGGRMEVSTTPDKGTTIRVIIPCDRAE